MTIFLPDANHASQLLVPSHPLWVRFEEAIRNGDEVVLLLDVVSEIEFGVEATRDPNARALRGQRLEGVLQRFPVVGLTLSAAREAGRIRGRLRRAGRQIAAVDAHLAGMAKVHGYVLVTADQDFQPLAGEIQVENWLP